LKITYEVVCEMGLYPSLTHYLARSLSKARLSLLTPTERAARTRAQKLMSNAKRRPTKTFAYPDAELPPRMDGWRDYLFDPKGRDILILTTKGHDIDCQPRKPRDE
jgi:hypothetical protein